MIRAKYEVTPLKGLQEKCKGKVEIIESPAEADAVVMVIGLNHKKGNDCEDADRTTLELPERQVELIKKTSKENPNIIVVLISGSPITMEDWIQDVPAVLEAWYPGMEGGHIIADILFGDVNPSGKLPLTFPKKLSDSPAHKSTRTYPGEKTPIDEKNFDEKVYYEEGIFVGYRHFDREKLEPLFAFGHGLSYTTFEYSNPQVNPSEMAADEKIVITMEIKNTGDRAGAEVVQLYVQDVEASVERPEKELKGFEKVFLEAGERKKVEFVVDKMDLSFFDERENCWKAEKGKFKILIGSSSRDIRLQAEFTYLG